MGKLVVTEFISIDGVFEDPGGAEEYEHGGWSFEYDRGEDGDEFKMQELMESHVQLLGRRTYEGFAEAWPSREGPFGQDALKQLEPLLGEWMLEAKSPVGEPWPGEARASFEWHESHAHLVARTTVDLPDAPNTVSIIGCDAANGTYFQLYSDERGVCRVYQMSIGGGTWTLWREGEPFAQRFTATISNDGNTIEGRREEVEDGTN